MDADSASGQTRRVFFDRTIRTLRPLLCGFGWYTLALAQPKLATVSGTVLDGYGALVPGATVTIKNLSNGEKSTATSGPDGRYTFAALPPGNYQVGAVIGDVSGRISRVSLAAGQAVVIDIPMEAIAGGGHGRGPQRPTRITGQDFLIDDHSEEEGFGLYSYILLGRRPPDARRESVLALIREYLTFPGISRLEREKTVTRDQLNVTYLPLNEAPQTLDANTVLQAYNYERAQVLLSNVPKGPQIDGPYIVSTETPLSSSVLSGPFLYQDLSAVEPYIITLWVREFQIQSTQSDYWKERNGPQAALRLRTAIATLAASIDPVKKAAAEWQAILSNLISWQDSKSKDSKKL